MTVDSSGMAEVGDSQQIEGVLSAIVSAISENMSNTATSEADSSDEEGERSDSEEEEEEQETSGALEGASAEEVLDSLRADIMRQLGVRPQSLPHAIITGVNVCTCTCRRLVVHLCAVCCFSFAAQSVLSADRIRPTPICELTFDRPFELFTTQALQQSLRTSIYTSDSRGRRWWVFCCPCDKEQSRWLLSAGYH